MSMSNREVLERLDAKENTIEKLGERIDRLTKERDELQAFVESSQTDLVRLSKENAELREALVETGRTCDFFSSVIKSGEDWSEATEASYAETLKLRKRALATLDVPAPKEER